MTDRRWLVVRLTNGHYPDCPRLRRPLDRCICGSRALRRKFDAEDAEALLRRALALTKAAPRTHARVRLALTSAGGAVRHAERMLAEVRRGN